MANKHDPEHSAAPRGSPGHAARPPHGRVVVVLFLCAGIAFLGLLSGGEHPEAGAGRARDPMIGYYGPDMPRYPGARELPAGARTEVGGSRVRMSYFVTKDGPLKVARHYEGFWRDRGLFVRRDVTHRGGVVSAVDVANNRVYQVLVAAEEEGTAAFPSETTAPLSAADPAGAPPPLPLMKGSRAVLNLKSEEAGKVANIHASVTDAEQADCQTHYRAELRARGYEKESESPTPKDPAVGEGTLWVYRREGSELTLTFTPVGEKRTRVQMVEVTSP